MLSISHKTYILKIQDYIHQNILKTYDLKIEIVKHYKIQIFWDINIFFFVQRK